MTNSRHPFQGAGRLDIPDERRREGMFLPRPLGSDLVLPSRVHQKLATAERALGRLDEAAKRLPGNAALVRSTQVREIQSSLGLDDVIVALREVLLSELPGQRSTATITPILAHYIRASDEAFHAIETLKSWDVELWLRIAGIIDPDNVDNAPAVDDADRAAMAQWVTWTNADCPLPLVGKLALGHYQFLVVQPFRAGSEHLARLYVGLDLARAGVLPGHVLPFSMWLDRHHVEYYQQVRRVVDSGEFVDWVMFFAHAIEQASSDQVALISDLESARDNVLAALTRQHSSLNAGSIQRVVAGLLVTPVTNHKQIAKHHGVSIKTATEVTKRLVAAGLAENLDSKTYGKVFAIPEYLRLLALNDPRPPTSDGDVFDT